MSIIFLFETYVILNNKHTYFLSIILYNNTHSKLLINKSLNFQFTHLKLLPLAYKFNFTNLLGKLYLNNFHFAIC